MYNKQIKLLKIIINHYDSIGSTPNSLITIEGHEFFVRAGLCYSALLEELKDDVLNPMVETWSLHDPERACTSRGYFIDGEDEYRSRNLYTNPRRLDFAKHALKFLENLQEKENG